jgi:NADH-quinone oxidoreductase subunit I
MDFPFIKDAIKQLFSKPSCNMYPFVPVEAAPKYRGRIVYHADRCIACGMCERVCAGGAISRTIEKLPDDQGEKITLSFDLGSCTFCSHCADFCSRDAIEFTTDYHMVGRTDGDLVVSGSFVKAPRKKPAAPAAKPESCEAAAPAAPTIFAREDGKPVYDSNKCVYCTLCAKKCPAGALTVDRANKTWTLDEDKCVSCGTCAEVCPKNAIIT